MNKLIVRRLEDGVLLPLQTLMGRLCLTEVSRWRLLDVELFARAPFHFPVTEFEENTKTFKGGLTLSHHEFEDLLEQLPQVIDGEIHGLSCDTIEPLVRIECQDAGQWEISTTSKALYLRLRQQLGDWLFSEVIS